MNAAPPPAARVEVVATRVPELEASDAAPASRLALTSSAGARVVLEVDAIAHAPFAGGVAVLRQNGAIELYTSTGARSREIADSAAPPVAAPNGDLLYGVWSGPVAELRRLSASGRERVVATGLGALGPVSPRADGSVLFVAAPRGGVAGLWVADDAGARCATNCELRTGEVWLDHVDLPFDVDAVRVEGGRLWWVGADRQPIVASVARGER